MKQEQIDKLDYLSSVRASLDSQLEMVIDEFESIRKTCDHKYPDGESAIISHSNLTICDICQKIPKGE